MLRGKKTFVQPTSEIEGCTVDADSQVSNGVHLVLTASNAQATIKYAFTGDASTDLSKCAPQVSNSPNGNPAADAMVSVIAHEFVKAVSDPTGTSWYDQAEFENADKCAWTYGKASKTTNGSFTNMTLGQR